MVEAEHLKSTDHVLVMDDFLANGEAIRGLTDLVNEAGATLEGIGIAIEKGFSFSERDMTASSLTDPSSGQWQP